MMDSGRGGMGSHKHGVSGHSHMPARTKQAIARLVNQLRERTEHPAEMSGSMDELLNRPRPRRRKRRRSR